MGQPDATKSNFGLFYGIWVIFSPCDTWGKNSHKQITKKHTFGPKVFTYIKGIVRGLLKKYTIRNRDYSITQLLDYDGVRKVVSSRKTEGSKRELLRDLLGKGVIVPSMITGRGAATTSTYGAQSRRAGKPLRTTASVPVEGPARFHDTVYEGPYDPMDRRYGGMKKGPLRNSKGGCH